MLKTQGFGHSLGLASLLLANLVLGCTSSNERPVSTEGEGEGEVEGTEGEGEGTEGEGEGTKGEGEGEGACVDTCPAKGETECRTPGFRTCGDQDGDGCLEWSKILECDAGWSCVDGKCVHCVNSCEKNSVQCGPEGGLQRCAINELGCLTWGAETPCPAGESCSAGGCKPVEQCEDECLRVGDTRCSGAGFQTCEASRQDECLHWSVVTPCGEQETCNQGACRPVEQCRDECEANSRRCSLNGYQTCGNYNDDPCVEWSAVIPCPAGQVCSDGRCAENCVNECGPEGQRICSGNGFQVCGRAEGTECLRWGLVQNCPAGQVCSNGTCRVNCVDECEDGTRRCSAGGVQTCGDFNDDGCRDWSAAVACDQGQVCSNGVCATQCLNECGVPNQTQCSGNGFQVCGNSDEDPCLEWGTVTACPQGESCSGGKCEAQCVDECAEGNLKCAGNGVAACGNYDDDTCREWSAVTPCPEGQVCSLGQCAANCVDACLQGSTRCAQNGFVTCGKPNGGACTDWGPVTPCPEGQVCADGQCGLACTDECVRGARRCVQGGFEECGDYDGDACAEWSQATPCPAGSLCSNGQCAASCSDECARDTLQCSGNGVRTCGNFDGDQCLDWSAVIPCPPGTSCSGGICTNFCQDECAEGQARCGAAGVEACGHFDGDPCLEWGAGVACPAGQVCANGACAAVCQDQCEAGQTRCGGNGVQTCSRFGDGCLGWSATAFCPAGEVCVGGACIPYEGPCNADAECGEGYLCLAGTCTKARPCQADDQCAAGERCDFLRGVCLPGADSLVGQACQQDADCGELLCATTDAGGYCTALCDAATPCPTGSACYYVDETEELAICLADCADAAGCAAGQACYPTAGPLGGACWLAECAVDADCPSDPLVQLACQNGQCVQQNSCDLVTGEGCPAGQDCLIYEGFGVCLAACQALANNCPAGQRCLPDGSVDGGYCVTAGEGGVGDPCRVLTDCDAGSLCLDDGLGNGTCRPTCDASGGGAACPAGDWCMSAFGGDLGVCVTLCESECVQGDIRCEGAAIVRCGNTNGDTCLEWQPAAACGPGQTCNILQGGCVAACASDQDCWDPLVDVSCQAGTCVPASECDPGTGEGCDWPDQCFIVTADGQTGACEETCDIYDPICLRDGTDCVLYGSLGLCLPAGNAGEWDPCSQPTDCAAGLACFSIGEQGNVCLRICDVSGAGCPAGQVCYDLELDGQLGVCLDGCVDECVLGSLRCSDDLLGTEECIQPADSQCTIWGASVDCPAGEFCDPATASCQVGCLLDADCPDIGLALVCDLETHTCGVPTCPFEGESCEEWIADGVCAPYDETTNLCLKGCDPLDIASCGNNGMCDYWPMSDGTVRFVCLSQGELEEYDPCESIGSCQFGMTCLPVSEEESYCLYYCDGDEDCWGDQACYAVAFFPETVGVCAPTE